MIHHVGPRIDCLGGALEGARRFPFLFVVHVLIEPPYLNHGIDQLLMLANDLNGKSAPTLSRDSKVHKREVTMEPRTLLPKTRHAAHTMRGSETVLMVGYQECIGSVF
jgi:hypothetical protein